MTATTMSSSSSCSRDETSSSSSLSSSSLATRLVTAGLWLPDAVGPAVDALAGLAICFCSLSMQQRRKQRKKKEQQQRQEEEGGETDNNSFSSSFFSSSLFFALLPAPSASLAFHASIVANSLPRVASLCHAAAVWALRGGGEKSGALASLFDLDFFENGDGGGENGLAAFLPSATGWLSAFAREDTQCSTPPSAMVTCVG